MKKLVYAIIPARSGSKGIKNKNIKFLDGKPMFAYSIDFAKALEVDRVFCSTDSEVYAEIAIKYGAEVPFLRNNNAAGDNAMEQDILLNLYSDFKKYKIPQPDFIIWLRPTFVFRSIDSVKECIDALNADDNLTSARTVCETESRLYKVDNNKILKTDFDDKNKSMIRRQDIETKYKVYSTDVIRSNNFDISNDFLGRNVYGVITNKICGLDIDDEIDFSIVESLIKHNKKLVNEYLY